MPARPVTVSDEVSELIIVRGFKGCFLNISGGADAWRWEAFLGG